MNRDSTFTYPLTSPEQRTRFVDRQLGASHADLERFPPYVNIETINTCNARCVMCGIDFDKRTLVRMSDALFDKIVAELSNWTHHIRKINLYCDCEPLLDRHLEKKIAALKAAGIAKVAIATNASSLTAGRSEELVKAGLDEIYISIDSMTPEVYEKIRVGLSFEKVYNNTLNFIRVRDELRGKTRVRVQMIHQDINDKEQEDFIAHWKERLNDGDLAVVHRAHNWGGAVDVMAIEGDEHINSIPCTSLWSNFFIHADGSVALCSVDTDDHSPHHVGNVKTQSIESIWTGQAMAAMRRRHLAGLREEHPMCNGCTAWREVNNDVVVEIKGKGSAAPQGRSEDTGRNNGV